MKIATPFFIQMATGILFFLFVMQGCVSTRPHKLHPSSESETQKKNDMYDGPDQAAEFEFNRIKDPASGKVPQEKYLVALNKTIELKNASGFGPGGTEAFGAGWIERGPVSDVVGSSNGNTRANSGITSGRIRSILVDAADATRKTVWVGGVDGGLWKTSDITTAPPTWALVNDFLNNLSIGDICQVPGTPATMYFCTGEGYFNADGVRGNGVFKSTNSGSTWTHLTSTAGLTCNRIICDAGGVIYLATGANIFEASGLLRSSDGGNTWTDITPTGSNVRIADMELSSTGRLHITTGLGNVTTGMYRFTDAPSTVTSATWTAATTPFPYPSGNNCRVELGCNGNILYALPSNTSGQVPTIYKSVNGGVSWAATTAQPAPGWATGQAWYALSVDIDPSDPTNGCIVGGLDPYKTTNGGTTWTKIADWTNNPGLPPSTTQYVHADIHKILWYDNGNKLLFACDGGIHYSSDKGVTIRDRNTGLRIKQFYSCAIHPSTTNYFIAGAQDNGNHKFTSAGLGSTEEFVGGDGAYVAIDQDQPQFQFAAYIRNDYRKSTDGGTSWSSVTWSSSIGLFINPWDYDNTTNKIYGCWTAGSYFRWDDPTTGSAIAVSQPVTAFNSALVSAVHVSPYTANQVYFGTNVGRIVKVSNANAAITELNITQAGMPAGYVNCVNTGTNDNNLIMCFSNYGVASVWVSSNGGISWTSLDNNGVNLPDMPVRWCMFYPGDNTKAIIATETGVWETSLINGTSTVWTVNSSFPVVRTDMLKYRASDGTIAAATHGRGLWTNTINSMLTADFRSKSTGNYSAASSWEFNTYGSTYIDAGAAPASTNNVTIQAAHIITLDAAQTIGASKTLVVNGTLNAGTNTVNGAGAFTLAAGGSFATSNTGANGISQNITVAGTKTFTDAANYIFNGASTAPFGSLFTTVKPNNVIAGANITLDKPVYITGALGFSGSNRTLTTGSNLTMGSSISGTSRIADITKDFITAAAVTGNSISGTATVERYIANAGHRAWHLLSAKAVTGAQTIFQSWQENGATGVALPNYGTWVTSNLFTGANGFDATSVSASILTHNQGGISGPSWNFNMANTNIALSSSPAYMLFVRGDRNYTPTLPTPTATNATTLRANGNVTQGTQGAVTVSATGTGRTLLGNPFASPVDLDAIFTGTTNLDQNVYIWDPTLTGNFGVGAFRVVQRVGANNYQATPSLGAGPDNTLRYMQSGQAFLLKATGANANVVFTEAHKTASVPVINPIVPTAGDQQLLVNLMIVNESNKTSLADGLRIRYDNSYRASVNDDIEKMGNFAENISSYREGKKLIVEQRPMIVAKDTVFLRTSNLGIRNYRLQINSIDFVQNGVIAILQDTWLKTKTRLNLDGNLNSFDFNVTADPASAAPDRFRIVFKGLAADVPVIPAGPKGITVYPNPVSNRTLQVRFTDMEKGMYQLRLVNVSGQDVFIKAVNHNGGDALQTVYLPHGTAKGSYRLVFIKPDETKITKSIVVSD
jgi:hypothetical protein